MIKIDVVTLIKEIQTVLKNNMVDPYYQAGGNTRSPDSWIFYQEPNSHAKHPKIVMKKFDNFSRPIDIGPDYTEMEEVLVQIFFYSKNGFKIVVNGTTYSNEQFVEYELGKIKDILKQQFCALQTAGVKMYKCVNTSSIGYDPDTQVYWGYLIVRGAFFTTRL